MKECIILQTYGIGDILFSEPIMNHYKNEGYKIHLPVEDEFIWIKDYIDYVNFYKKSEYKFDYEINKFITVNDIEVIPLRFSNGIYRNQFPYFQDENCMLDKYRLLNLSENLWRTLKFNRNYNKEIELYNLLNSDNSKYNLVNINFGMNGNKIPININNQYKNINMDIIKGYTLLDWCKLIENAENIYTVSTSNLYLLETLNLKAKEIHLYPRFPYDGNLNQVRQILSNKYILHE